MDSGLESWFYRQLLCGRELSLPLLCLSFLTGKWGRWRHLPQRAAVRRERSKTRGSPIHDTQRALDTY